MRLRKWYRTSKPYEVPWADARQVVFRYSTIKKIGGGVCLLWTASEGAG